MYQTGIINKNFPNHQHQQQQQHKIVVALFEFKKWNRVSYSIRTAAHKRVPAVVVKRVTVQTIKEIKHQYGI